MNFDTISNQTRNNQEIGQVIEAFSTVKELSLTALHDNQFFNIEKIAQLKELTHLHIYIKRQIKMPGFQNLKNLKSLVLHNQIDSATGKILNSCKDLRYLSLYSCSLGFETGKKLSELKQLTTLNLNECRRYFKIGEWLKNCQSLQHLKISYVDIDSQLLKKIQSLKI
ncbi:MAG: hypothetical protein HWD61_02080 [Parachlamydiaceae bacterium]|nr:MAG: hypothetical protein HWD61_02080 [Parachlamydiaceae bacterium]